ncbi:MAG TPA: GTPase ObgE [Planctomycetaceae bacterium]|nr:GTPase ObgE [Planctomycetaceae bacterium]
MFLDRITIHVKGGDGGDGCVSFRREYKIAKGGPSGGDGGRGGSIIIEAAANVDSLAALAGHKHWRAESGRPGEGSYRQGRSAEDVIIRVPPGTIIRDAQRGNVIRDLAHLGERVVVARGGRGGRGNDAFKTATNRAPREFEPGEKGEERKISLELKVIADVGVIGKPNAGKSTLLSRLSRAQPEIADYPFTTKYPNLGMVQVGDEHSFAMADIPGLIEGAHAGAGLGHEFLRHVERCRLLVHLVEPEPLDQSLSIDNYRQIREELRLYDPNLARRPEIICVSKAELPSSSEVAQELSQELGCQVHVISAVTGRGLPQLVNEIWRQLQVLDVPAPLAPEESIHPAQSGADTVVVEALGLAREAILDEDEEIDKDLHR